MPLAPLPPSSEIESLAPWLTVPGSPELRAAQVTDAALDPALIQMRMALEVSGAILWHRNLEEDTVYCNANGLTNLGPPPNGQLAWTRLQFIALIHPDDLDTVREADRVATETGQPVEASVRYRHRLGHWIHALTRRQVLRNRQGQPSLLLGAAMDLTEAQRTLGDLRLADEQIALVTQGVGIGIWQLDLQTRAVLWDPQMWLLRGRSPDTRAPGALEALAWVHPEDLEYARHRLKEQVTEAPQASYEFRVVWPDGQVRWLASRSMVMRDPAGTAVKRIGVNWDITEVRQAAADRHERALAQRESEAKSELLARLSHELRTPLNAVLGFTRLLIEDDAVLTPARRRNRLHHIESAGQHLLSLINDVLELARPESPEPPMPLQAVNLAELLDQTLPMVEAQAEARRLQWRLEVPPLAALADPVRLKQVLLNLLTNAIKYNREGGWIQLSAAAMGGRVLLRVTDSGVGMAPEQIREAFEPFHRLRNHQPGVEGVGIGLAIVKTLVQRMGGTVQVRSRPGEGSTFELGLTHTTLNTRGREPADDALDTPHQPSLLPPPEPTPGGARLLYVEDNPVNMMIVEELVARRGDLPFIGAADAAQGLAQARAQRPDLILMDMHLPDAHGHQLLASLRADPLTRHIPCVALSANALPADIEAALQLGFADYWTKPLDFRAFHQALDMLFGEQRAMPALPAIADEGMGPVDRVRELRAP